MTTTIDKDLTGPAEPGEATDPRGDGPDLDDFSGDEDGVDDPVLALAEQLKLHLPSHAYYQVFTERRGPHGILVGPGGQRIEIPQQPSGVKVRWSTPNGIWRVLASPCGSNPELLHYSIKGPNTLIERDDKTLQHFLEKLHGALED